MSATQREELLDELARLIAQHGADPFVRAPLVTADARFFPDPFAPDARGVRTVVRRLLQHIGLGDLPLALNLADDESHTGVPVWFQGIDADGVCHFDMAAESADKWSLVAGLAHEVAHAHRTFNGLFDDDDRDRDERLTDLTAIYLGLGILATCSPYRGGSLEPELMAELLAWQVAARDWPGERAAVEAQLEPSQRDAFRAALASTDAAALRARLALPERSLWSEPVVPRLAPLSADGEPELTIPVLRVRRTARQSWSFAGAVAGMVAAVPFALASPATLALCALGGALVGGVLGARRRRDRCADPGCGARLAVDATTCPGCGGTVVGEIAHHDERLAALEDWERRRR